MDVREEILDYVNRNELTGALLLTGPWGCGKSYLVKEIAKELNSSKKAAVATISLFGLDSVAAINKRVKDEYVGFMLGGIGKTVRKVSKAVGELAKDGANVASIATDGSPGLSAVSHGIASVMAYNPFDFIEIKNSVGKDKKERNFILVFDDLERSNISKKDLLGALNEYVENKQIRVIIVADEEKIASEDYKEYKEKLISRTIRMAADYGALIDQIVEAYSETSTGYKAFLVENRELIKQVFSESKSFNLRTLKSALADFERIYSAWIVADIALDNMKWALYTFTSEVFISRGYKKKDDSSEKGGRFMLLDKSDLQYESKGKNHSTFYSLGNWINNGIWNHDEFVQELIRKFTEDVRTPMDRFLHYDIWSLEKGDIDEGLPAAVEHAYNGDLSRDDLLSLLEKLHYLKDNSIDWPCEVDYQKIEAGFDSRIASIKSETVTEPENRIYASDDQIDVEAHPLFEKINQLEYVMTAWGRRKLFMAYISRETEVSGYALRGCGISEFDDELLSLFKKQYSKASNGEKREYALILMDLDFNSDYYSTAENKEMSKRNFRNLIDWLEEQNADDSIATIINQSLIHHIKEKPFMQT